MSSRRFAGLSVLGLTVTAHLLAPHVARAQQGVAVLVGAVRDAATDAPVPDVVVTATSPALQGEEIGVTDAAGQYRIPNLPPGVYTIRFEREEFRVLAREAVPLRADSTIRLDTSLLPETITGETVVVVGRAPSVDVGSSTTGMSITSEFTHRVPLAMPAKKGGAQRTFESVASAAPGAYDDDYGVAISGATSPENHYVVDGLSTNNPAFGINGTPMSLEFVSEMNVITGGYMPEYGRASGGILDVVTKSGSNEFHGAAWMNVTPGALQGEKKEVQRARSTVQGRTALGNLGDLGVDVGGPIVKDRLWFYTGLELSRSTYDITRTWNRAVVDAQGQPIQDANGFTQTTPIPGTTRTFGASGQGGQAIGKLTYAVDSHNRVSLTAFGARDTSGGGGDFGLDPDLGGPEVGNVIGQFGALAHRYRNDTLDLTGKWSSESEDKRLLFDATVGWHHQSAIINASDGTGIGEGGLAATPLVDWRRSSPGLHSINDFETLPDPSVCDPAGTPNAVLCPVPEYLTGGPGYLAEQALDRVQGRAVVTTMFTGAGHHIVKAGLDLEAMQYRHRRASSGGNVLREATDGGSFADAGLYGYLTGSDAPRTLAVLDRTSRSIGFGGFVQDSWSVLDTVTVNAGMRYDAQLIYGQSGGVAIALPNEISPRVGVVYDFLRNGHSKVFANYARFYESVPLDIADRVVAGEPSIRSVHDGAACDPQSPGGASACSANGTRLVTGSATTPDQKWQSVGAGRSPVDPSLKPQSSDEFVTGGELDVVKDGRVGAYYTRRWLNAVIEDMSRDEAQSYFIGNPGYGIAADFPKAERTYDAMTLFFHKSFSDGWIAQASYTLAYLRGNYAGLYRSETLQLDPNNSSDFDLRSLLANRYGPLPSDRRHEMKIYGAHDLPLTTWAVLDLGGSVRGTTGEPTNVLGSHPIYGAGEVFVLDRGSGERLPFRANVDARVGLTFRLPAERAVTVSCDVFNVLNFQTVTFTDENYTLADVSPVPGGKDLSKLLTADGKPFDPGNKNPQFGKPVAYQSPRIFRFGVRGTF